MFNCYTKNVSETSIFYKRSLKISKGYSDVINRGNTDKYNIKKKRNKKNKQ